MSNDLRNDVARRMVSTLPKFGGWATAIRDFETPYGKVGFRQLAILWAVRYELIPPEEMSPTTLADLFQVQPSVITSALAKLEANEFVERTVDDRDSRRFLITITEKGQTVSEYVEQLLVQEIVDSISAVDDEQLGELGRSIDLLDGVVEDLTRKRRQVSKQPRRRKRPSKE